MCAGAGVDTVAHFMALYVWFDHGLGKFKVFGSYAGGFVLLGLRTSLRPSIGPRHDEPRGDSASLCSSPENNEALLS